MSQGGGRSSLEEEGDGGGLGRGDRVKNQRRKRAGTETADGKRG